MVMLLNLLVLNYPFDGAFAQGKDDWPSGDFISSGRRFGKRLVVYGAGLQSTGTRFFGAWTAEGGNFIGWMRTRPNLAGDTPDAVHAIGEVLGRSVFRPEESASCALHDALELFRRALQEAARDLGVD